MQYTHWAYTKNGGAHQTHRWANIMATQNSNKVLVSLIYTTEAGQRVKQLGLTSAVVHYASPALLSHVSHFRQRNLRVTQDG